MTELANSAALLVTGAAVVAAGLVFVRTGRLAVALPVFLDLLLAASLLHLMGHPSRTQLAGAAALVLVKQIAKVGIRTSAGARTRP